MSLDASASILCLFFKAIEMNDASLAFETRQVQELVKAGRFQASERQIEIDGKGVLVYPITLMLK
jgi:hypothetical protein